MAICFLFCFCFCKDHFSLFHLGGILNRSGKMVNRTKQSWREAICFSLFCIVVLIKVDAKGLIKLVQQSVLRVLDMQEYNKVNCIQHIYSNYTLTWFSKQLMSKCLKPRYSSCGLVDNPCSSTRSWCATGSCTSDSGRSKKKVTTGTARKQAIAVQQGGLEREPGLATTEDP